MAQQVKILAALPDNLCWADPQNLNSGRRARSCRMPSDLHVCTPTHIYRKNAERESKKEEGRIKMRLDGQSTLPGICETAVSIPTTAIK